MACGGTEYVQQHQREPAPSGKVSLISPPLQLIHQNRQAILNQFAASSPVGINMRAGMQQQITPQVMVGTRMSVEGE